MADLVSDTLDPMTQLHRLSLPHMDEIAVDGLEYVHALVAQLGGLCNLVSLTIGHSDCDVVIDYDATTLGCAC